MKIFLTGCSLAALLCLGAVAQAQTTYKLKVEYDAAGNRKHRVVTSTTGGPSQRMAADTVDHELYGISLMPNPTTREVQLNLPVPETEGLYILQLYDPSGKPLFKQEVAAGSHSLDLGPYADGEYLLLISQGKRFKTERIIKAKWYE